MANEEIKTSLDDLVALLLNGKAPFEDDDFSAAANFYRHNSARGAIGRQQVNLAACLYLEVKKERIAEPRIRELGGWGSRNDMLADMASFSRGRRPATTASLGHSSMALGAPPADVLQIAVSQGLEAAQKALEASIRKNFDLRIDEIQALADQRVLAAERNALAATELKEAAQAESRLMEQKFDQAITGRTELQNRAATAEARADELTTQVAALTASLAQANDRLTTAEQGARALQAQLDELQARREAERREHMLALDRARHGNDQLLATQQAEISRLGALLERTQEAGEGHAQAARRAEALAASTQAELAAAVAKMADLQAQIETLTTQASKVTEISEHTDEILGGLEALGQTLAGMRGASAESVAAVAGSVAGISDALQEIGRKVDGLSKKS